MHASIKKICLSILFLSLANAKDFPNTLDEKWKKSSSSLISDHALYFYADDPSIILKTSKISIPSSLEINKLTDNDLLDQAFKGKDFSDKIYQNTSIQVQSSTINRDGNNIEIIKKESYQNDMGNIHHRINKIYIQETSFHNAELIWPLEKDDLVKNFILHEFEKINAL